MQAGRPVRSADNPIDGLVLVPSSFWSIYSRRLTLKLPEPALLELPELGSVGSPDASREINKRLR